MPLGLVVIILTAVIGGLSFASLAMWIQSKEKLAKAGAPSGELEALVAAQQEALQSAERRIQNLEAIVTSQSWDALTEGKGLEAAELAALPAGRLEIDESEEELGSTAERAARLARRV